LDDPAFPQVSYRHGASGWPMPVLRGTGMRVQTVLLAVQQWGLSPEQIAAEYGLSRTQVQEALAFCEAHRPEIEAGLSAERALDETHA
jgi:uncharacterized protein (DUF433 family)